MGPTYYMASAARQMAILEALRRRSRPGQALASVCTIRGANLPASVQIELERALGVPVIQSYGMNETGVIAQAPCR